MKIPLYLTRIQLHGLFVGCVRVSFMWSLFIYALLDHDIHQAARELQARFNTQRNLAQNLQRKFDDISNSPDGDDDNSTPPPKKRGRRSGDPDEPNVEEAETEEVKRLGRRFVILHGPWLKRREHIFEVEFDEDYDEKDRFKDNDTMAQGQLHEIRGLLPEKYHGDAFTKRWLSKSVSNVWICL
jgi:hypothetical protein